MSDEQQRFEQKLEAKRQQVKKNLRDGLEQRKKLNSQAEGNVKIWDQEEDPDD